MVGDWKFWHHVLSEGRHSNSISRDNGRELGAVLFCPDAIQIDVVPTTQSICERHSDEEITGDEPKRRLGKSE